MTLVCLCTIMLIYTSVPTCEQSRKKCPSVPQANYQVLMGSSKLMRNLINLDIFHTYMHKDHIQLNTLLISFWLNYENPVHLLEGFLLRLLY